MNNKQNIIIIGMPGSGKTTFGKALAQRLGRDFYDADDVIVEQEGKTIPELFAVSEDCFRDAEVRADHVPGRKVRHRRSLRRRRRQTLGNMDIFKKTGTVFFLDRSPDDIVSDVDVSTRPLLKDGKQKVYDLYDERIALYRNAADYRVPNNKTIEEVLDAFEELIKDID